MYLPHAGRSHNGFKPDVLMSTLPGRQHYRRRKLDKLHLDRQGPRSGFRVGRVRHRADQSDAGPYRARLEADVAEPTTTVCFARRPCRPDWRRRSSVLANVRQRRDNGDGGRIFAGGVLADWWEEGRIYCD